MIGYYKLPVNYRKLTDKERREVRLQYVDEQKGACYYCRSPLDQKPPGRIEMMKIDWSLFPPGFLKAPVHLHHDHNTGMTLGAVHSRCNAVLWFYHGE